MINACYQSVEKEINTSECIPPLYNVAIPVVPKGAGTVKPREIPPQGNWSELDALPFPQNEIGTIYMRPFQNELWLTTKNGLYRYFMDKKEWRSYQFSDPTSIKPTILFVSNKSAIWGVKTRFTGSSTNEMSSPFLLRFNDALDRFEYVEDSSGFLKTPDVRLVSNIVEDQNGLLWFFVDHGKSTLISFDPETERSRQHFVFDVTGVNPDMAIGLDDSIWFEDYFNEELVRYIPSTQETQRIKMQPQDVSTIQLVDSFRKANYIFVDRMGRLWVANYGWLDLSNENFPLWHKVVESPVFITDRGLPDTEYMMGFQYSTYQSSNGLYWFTGGNGIVRLDYEKGEWCLITTGVSKVVEDNDHNLWIAVYGNLYKNSHGK